LLAWVALVGAEDLGLGEKERRRVPWPKNHKAQVRKKIVTSAATALRAGGISGMSVDDVMTQAGLTHGAFYAHFESKDDLLRAALEYAADETLERFSKKLAPVPEDSRLAAAVGAYLSRQHVDHPETGCPVAALAPEVTRAGGKTRRALVQGIRKRIEWTRTLLPRRLQGAGEDEILVGTLSCMLGAVVLARCLGGEGSDAVLEHARRFIDRALAARSR
jgi:TetR/AcrR family transcriptional repressor of nem operon